MSEYTEKEITSELGSSGLFVTPDAASKIQEESTSKLIETIIEVSDEGDTIDESAVNELISKQDNKAEKENKEKVTQKTSQENPVSDSKLQSEPSIKNDKTIDPQSALNDISKRTEDDKNVKKILNRKETLDDRHGEIYDSMFDRDIPEAEDRLYSELEYEIKGDITGESRGEGKFSDYQKLFEDRFEKIFDLLSQRTGRLLRVSEINPRRHGGEGITVAGLVHSTFVSDNDNYFIDLEDPDTNEVLRVGWTDDEIKEVFEKIVPDEVIAVRGNLSEPEPAKEIGLSDVIIWGDDERRKGRMPIMFPDVPSKRNRNRPNSNIEAAMIGDIHLGANEFYSNRWNKFVDWVRTTPSVRYIFIVGDLVEGIGVYPDQKEELNIVDIYDQYAMMGRMLDEIPDDVKIFATVGNHDTVRLAEPQPTLDEQFRKYFPDNVEFVGNPININLGGVEFLMYHGMSINAISESIPGLDPKNPIPIMKQMLVKRHVAPEYGKNVRLAPEEKDYLVIEDVPDILHCGHVHKYGEGEYNNVKMVNTATWQGQTSFQKSKGISPEVGYWSVVNLSNLDTYKMTAEDI